MHATIEERAGVIISQIRRAFPVQPDWRFVTGLAEEAGEVVGAYNRYTGTARRSGTIEELAAEMADTVLTTYMLANVLGIDMQKAMDEKFKVITHRGWRQP